MKTKFCFVRHAESTNNRIANDSPWHRQWIRMFRKDPHLTTAGWQLSKKKKLPSHHKVDVVFCSPLLRSIETARAMFPRKRLIIGPFLRETKLGAGNFPDRKHRPHSTMKNVDTRHEQPDSAFRKHMNHSSLYDFVHEFYRPTYGHNKRYRYIVVVTHSYLMKRDLDLRERPPNLGHVCVCR